MTGLRALVLEDEAPARDYLCELLQGCHGVASVVAVGSSDEATAAMRAGDGVDAVFVDIRLVDRPGDTSGLTWARAVAASGDPPLLVFATAMPDHALLAFETDAADYLLKPFTRQRVVCCVERLCRRRSSRAQRAPARLLARTATSLVFLPLDGVYAFEAAERITLVHHADGRFLVDLSLAALEHDVNLGIAATVLRVHRSWLVAIAHVRQLERGSEPTLVVGPELRIPVSRDRAAAVRDALLENALGSRR
jgi:DNA-binding LytR/AlgR family response regulator